MLAAYSFLNATAQKIFIDVFDSAGHDALRGINMQGNMQGNMRGQAGPPLLSPPAARAMKMNKMRVALILICLAVGATDVNWGSANAQEAVSVTNMPGAVSLAEPTVAIDAAGRTVDITAKLLTTTLSGTPDAPVRNARLAFENRSAAFYRFVSGRATFYDAQNLRCGEGLWTVNALAPNETAEADMPGLRLACTPTAWRVTVITLITQTSNAINSAANSDEIPPALQPIQATESAKTSTGTSSGVESRQHSLQLPSLIININGVVVPIQLGNALEIKVGAEQVRIILSAAPSSSSSSPPPSSPLRP